MPHTSQGFSPPPSTSTPFPQAHAVPPLPKASSLPGPVPPAVSYVQSPPIAVLCRLQIIACIWGLGWAPSHTRLHCWTGTHRSGHETDEPRTPIPLPIDEPTARHDTRPQGGGMSCHHIPCAFSLEVQSTPSQWEVESDTICPVNKHGCHPCTKQQVGASNTELINRSSDINR